MDLEAEILTVLWLFYMSETRM